MKSIFITAFLLILSHGIFGQEQGKFRGNFCGGIAIPSKGVGLLTNVEGNYNILKNLNAGIRINGSFVAKDMQFKNSDVQEANFGINASYMATVEYFFIIQGSLIPYLGCGLGNYRLANVNLSGSQDFNSANLGTTREFGGMIRAGFELNKFRYTMEYNFIPQSELVDNNGSRIGLINNAYLAITAGFFFGGGNWKSR